MYSTISDDEIKSVMTEYGNLIYRLALHYLKRQADAEDIVQEVILAYLLHYGKRKEKSWFIKVTVNKCLDLLKKRKRIADKAIDGYLEAPSPLGDDLFEELQKLTPINRKIIYLYYYEGYSSKEIGKMLHKSDTAVRKQLARAKAQLKVILEENHHDQI